MLYQKRIENYQGLVLVYFVDEDGNKQGTLKAYSADNSQELREQSLVYTQEYKNGEPTGERVNLFYEV